jgi:hypothetical protein
VATITRLPHEIAETAEALVLMAAAAASTPLVGSRRRRWGATAEEASGPMPGDELVPTPKWSYTYGITIHAPREGVWPWLAQIGQGRGGFYSYQTLENMFGCRIRNVDHIVPDLQAIEPGDTIRLHPSAPPLAVAIVDPPTSLVLHGDPSSQEQPGGGGSAVSTWQFQLNEAPGGTTRLLSRGRSDYGPGAANRLFFGPFPMEPVLFVMSRKMMQGIKHLAEAAA